MRPLGKHSSLTEWEVLGINSRYNLADGHAHHDLTVVGTQPEVIGRLFLDAELQSQDATEQRFVANFQVYAQQEYLPSRWFLHYSSSLSIEIIGKVLRERGADRVGVLTPTFDNIPLLLRRCGLTLVPMHEQMLSDAEAVAAWTEHVDAIFIVQPNNPSGYVAEESHIRRLISACAINDVVYCCDSSFRFFDTRSEWQQYAYLREVSGQYPEFHYMMVEDTGKTWPLRELKVGILFASDAIYQAVEVVSEEVMLNVSPFTLNLLSYMMESQDRNNFVKELRELVKSNRRYLREVIPADLKISSDAASAISVEWLQLPSSLDSHEFCVYCKDRGIVVLPGRPFGWDNPSEAASNFRVALMREPIVFREGVQRLAGTYRSFRGRFSDDIVKP